MYCSPITLAEMASTLSSEEAHQEDHGEYENELQSKGEKWARAHKVIRDIVLTDAFRLPPYPARDGVVRSLVERVRDLFNLPVYRGRQTPLHSVEAFADRLLGGLEELGSFASEINSMLHADTFRSEDRSNWKRNLDLLEAYQVLARKVIDEIADSENLNGFTDRCATPWRDLQMQADHRYPLSKTTLCRSRLSSALAETLRVLDLLNQAWSAHSNQLIYVKRFEEVLDYVKRNSFFCESGLFAQDDVTHNSLQREIVAATIREAEAQGECLGQVVFGQDMHDHVKSIRYQAAAPVTFLRLWAQRSQSMLDRFDTTQMVTDPGHPIMWSSSDDIPPHPWDLNRLEEAARLPLSMPPEVHSLASRLPALVETVMCLQEELDDLPTGRVRRMFRASATDGLGQPAAQALHPCRSRTYEDNSPDTEQADESA